FLVQDRKRIIAADTPTRASLGLPEQAFVFCCFNSSWKYNSAIFDVWMRLLSRVEGSVLWLLKSNDEQVANMCREARARGVDPDRIIFAPHLPDSEHLARHRAADLFLDTLPYNAHAT